MSVDTAAVKRIIKNLKTMTTKAAKVVDLAKAEREARMQILLGDYQTEEDIQNAYGYEEITSDEREALLATLEGKKNPNRRELSEEEIYVLELKDLITIATKRLRDLEWDELPEEEQDRINAANAAAHVSRRSIRKEYEK